ncbi:CCA tRNA nucleotidyltransferase [Phenylobacterium sp.]|uniref:CCA tRNA nucleotidyltransferase n=1 Tax=Phenylobacterium sp. TaxID=1871053 RepID=UPI0012164F31|nr:CCA tRNA nucleotidyltransferase [Phenylobacterium sp.]THD68169.1 MAG: CCA tRNA nucleotidyltransferase [Phenylobacterium sp.]
MSETIGQRPWMTAADTAAVLDALEAAGGLDCARFVGGCVRNTLLGKPVSDLDIATRLTPDEVTAALKAAGLKAVPTGVEHGTVTGVSGGKPFEITTLRRDVATDGRRAVVAFTDDWAEDAGRRDFTLNSLYARRDGTLFDPTGHGIADARAGRIVFVGEAEERVREDYLRILRFFRFFAWYGSEPPDAAALAACEALRGELKTLSAERVSKELLKLLAADDPRPAVALMARTGVLGEVLPAPIDLARFEGMVTLEDETLFETEPLLRLAALLPDDQLGAVKFSEALRLSNAERDRLAAALAPTPEFKSWMSPREIRRTLYRLGAQPFRDRVKLAWARAARTATTPQWRGMIALGEGWSPPAFPLTGDDVIAAGAPKGPMVGRVLREVEEWWIDHDFIDDKLSTIEKLKSVVQGMAF